MTTVQSISQFSLGLQPICDYSIPVANQIYTLPTGSNIKAGQRVKLVNGAGAATGFTVSMNASNGSLVRTVYAGADGEVMCIQDNPTDTSHWVGMGSVTSNWGPTGGTWQIKGGSNGTTYTNSTIASSIFKRDGDTARFKIEMLFQGLPAGGTGPVALLGPAAYQIDQTKQPVGNVATSGIGTLNISGGTVYPIVVTFGNYNFGSQGFFNVYFQANANAVTPTTPASITSGSTLTCDFIVPILGWSATKG